jgi:uncharacterized membrane protein YgcG
VILLALLIGVVLIVAAIRGTQGALFSALAADTPPFVVWAAAIFALGVIGYVPGLKPVSRALIALVLVVIILKNWQTILSGFQSFWQNPKSASGGTGQAAPTPGGGSFGGAGTSGSWGPATDQLPAANTAIDFAQAVTT